MQYHLHETVGKFKMEAAELVGLIIGWSNRAAWDWKAQFYENDGNIQESKQGKYQQSSVLWENKLWMTKYANM